jgi:hypothetical protein
MTLKLNSKNKHGRVILFLLVFSIYTVHVLVGNN